MKRRRGRRRRSAAGLVLAAAIVMAAAPARSGGDHQHHSHEGCPCPVAPAESGWCDVCAVGYVGPVEVHSRALHETLDPHGHRLDPDSFDCDSCKRAMKEDGYCDEHRIGFVDGLTYFSRLAYEVARAERADTSADECPDCVATSTEPVWCDACSFGRLGDRIIRDRAAFERVREAVRVLRIADEWAAHCEHCAVAVVTDTECPVHRRAFRGGEMISGPPAPPP